MFRRGALALAVVATAACHHPASTTTPPPPPGSTAELEARVAKLERRLAKMTAFLNTAVPPTVDENHTYAVPVDPLDPVVGPADAKVTIIEAFEYLCPYCEQVAPAMEQLAAKYPKDVRIVSKYLVIHGMPAIPPGLAACAAAKQGKYAPMQKAIWSTIWPTAGEGADREQATADALEATARTVGLDLKRFKTDVDSADCKAWFTHSTATLTTFGASATPSFYINGRPFSDGRTLEEFSAAVDAELAKVNASGIPAARYYDEAVIKRGEPKAIVTSQFED